MRKGSATIEEKSAQSWDEGCPDLDECLAGRPCKRIPFNFFPLCALNPGDIVKVVRTAGGRGVESKLAAMGIHPGAEVRAISNLGGPMIIEVKGSRLSIGRGLASKIMVEK